MASLSKELVFLILQYLNEENFADTVHLLEKESGVFFNMKYFEEVVTNGKWDEVEKYLSGFTKVVDNRYSMKMYFEICKQKYLEALDRREHGKAVEILAKELKVFSNINKDLFKEMTMLLTLNNFRENEQLSKYTDAKSQRAIVFHELKRLIEANPLFRDKLQFPFFTDSRLRTLINYSLNWLHQACQFPRPEPEMKTLFLDHSCGQPDPSVGAMAPSPVTNPLAGAMAPSPVINPLAGAMAPSPVTNPLAGAMARVTGFPSLAAHGVSTMFQPFQHAPAGFTSPLAGWMTNAASKPHQTVSAGPMGLAAASAAAMVKRPRTATDNPVVDNRTADSDLALKKSRPLWVGDEGNMPANILPISIPGPSHTTTTYSADDLPKTVVANFSQGSAVKSMDFHPRIHCWLLVGTNIGDVALWNVASKQKLAYQDFEVWELPKCSVTLQASLASEYTASVNRVTWSPDGILLGVAYSKHLVHIYTYVGGTELRNHLEIEAHAGNVSDLAFGNHPSKKQTCIITCGEDKAIKVWDTAIGSKLFIFEGHKAPVYSVCPHQKQNIQLLFSTAVDGKIKAWLYEKSPCRMNYDAPGHSCSTMASTADGKRLFSCGTNKEGESFLVEWNEDDGAVKRSYVGLGKRSVGVIQFHMMRKLLAAGDEFAIKFWDMDSVNLLATVDAGGGLPASPCVRFNKEGLLLAVSTNDNGIKVLASTEGIRRVRLIESSIDASRAASGFSVKTPLIGNFATSSPNATTNIGVGKTDVPVSSTVASNRDNQSLPDAKPDVESPEISKLTEISESSQLRSLRLPDHLLPVRIMRLRYTNSGGALLSLAYNATHKLWKWQKNERNVTGKATSSVEPQLWIPSSGILMTNEIKLANPEEAVPCFALSKNDSYVLSASGGRISLFNMLSFKTMTTFMASPPAATSIAFHPKDNNILAIGMEDSTIQIYNVRTDQVISKLKGHQKRVTGLTFSNDLKILISSGADSQLCVWSTNGWVKQACKHLQMPSGLSPNSSAHTRVQFHLDQIHVLAIHESQVALYETSKLECKKQWFPPRESSGAITDATYSCDSQLIYVSTEDGNVSVLVASTLALRCTINPAAYLPSNPSNRTYPVSLAAHPLEPNQLALGLSDGSVYVLEPPEADPKWGIPPSENGVGPSASSSTAASDQQSR